MKPLSLFLVCLILSGCATSSETMGKIHLGMTRAEVITMLGDPVFTEAKANQETLVFNLSESRVSEALFGGAARGLNIGKNHYRVEFIDGKVTAYYRAEGR